MDDSEDISAISIQELYGHAWATGEEFSARLDRSLRPRGPEMLYDRASVLGLGEGDRALDLGCRDARHACELASRFGCRVVAIDPVERNVARARELVEGRGLTDRVSVATGGMESIPCSDGELDFIWCRDVTNHVANLASGFRECARVLRPGGRMLLYQTFSTSLLEPEEAARLYAWTATNPRNMCREAFVFALAGSGLRIEDHDIVSSAWRERAAEDGHPHTARQLLRIARIRRDRDRLVAEFGRTAVDAEMGDCLWGVYQMLGKLCPMVYVIVRE